MLVVSACGSSPPFTVLQINSKRSIPIFSSILAELDTLKAPKVLIGMIVLACVSPPLRIVRDRRRWPFAKDEADIGLKMLYNIDGVASGYLWPDISWRPLTFHSLAKLVRQCTWIIKAECPTWGILPLDISMAF